MEILNRKAHYNYYIKETYEAGIELVGTEIKSIRKGSCNINECYGRVKNSEIFLTNMYIAKYDEGNRFNHDERRERKLLSKLGGGALLDIGIYNLGLISTLGLKDLSISSTRVKLNEYNTDSYSETKLIAANGALITSINAID